MGAELKSERRRENSAQEPVADAAPLQTDSPRAPVPLSRSTMVGSADDPLEAAADRAADAALSRLAPGGDADTHLHGAGCGHLRRVADEGGSGTIGSSGGELDAGSSDLLASRRGKGRRLSGPVLNRMETAFGQSFSGVNIHDDATSDRLARHVSARAFTTGNDIFFAGGQYDPDSLSGERVLAHELAHTLQTPHAGGAAGGMQRWFGRKEDPAEKARKEQEAEDKKRKKEEAKAQAKQTKQNSKENKKLESTESKHLAAERKTGVAGRKEIVATMLEEQKVTITKDQAGKEYSSGKTSESANRLHAEFEKRLALEKDMVEQLSAGMARPMSRADAEKVAQEAYDAVWLDPALPKDLRAVRPPRETAAERLAYEISKARLGEKSNREEIERGKVGSMLSKSVERVYEAWEAEVERLTTGPMAVDRRVADLNAGIKVWADAPEEIRKQRPTDPRIERQARLEARNRLAYGRKTAQTSKEKSAAKKGQPDDGVSSTTEMVGDGFKTGSSITGPVTQVPGNIIGLTHTDIDKDLKNGNLVAAGKDVKSANGMSKVDLQPKKGEIDPGTQHTDIKVGQGFTTCGEILSDLFDCVSGMVDLVKTIKKTFVEPNAVQLLELGKSVNARAKTALNLGQHAMELAKFINEGVSSAVASVVPGFNIALSVVSVIDNVLSLAQTAIKMAEVNGSLVAARGRVAGAKKVDVMVYPLLHVHEVFAKQLANVCFTTTTAVIGLGADIATVASGGGYGVPTAVKLATKVSNVLNTVGHTVADQILVYLAKQSKVEGQILKSEGGAEGQLKRDPAQAIDAIIVRARQKDQVAISFLVNYGVKEADIDESHLSDTRAKVLERVGENADPAYIYESVFEKGKKLLATPKAMLEKWKDTGSLSKNRNEMKGGAKTDRGFGWRLKMMFKGEEKFERSKNKTKAQMGMEDQIACRVKGVILLKDATDTEIGQFATKIEAMSDGDLMFAMGDDTVPPDIKELIGDLLTARLAKNPIGAGR